MITRDELIDFYMWCSANSIDHNIPSRIEAKVDLYIKSIKSSTDKNKVCILKRKYQCMLDGETACIDCDFWQVDSKPE